MKSDGTPGLSALAWGRRFRRPNNNNVLTMKLSSAFPATDMVADLAIFNIRGNHYRLIVRLVFRYRRIYIKEFLTHAEYDKGR